MKTFDLLLSSINDVKDFVNIVSKYDFDVDLTSGRYVVDAKSIMGIFSLDLSKPIKVEVHSDDCDKFHLIVTEFQGLCDRFLHHAIRQVAYWRHVPYQFHRPK